MTTPISRRTLLRGTGAALALPLLESMLPSRVFAASEAPAPRRMLIYTTAGGTVIESWKPKAAGKLEKLPSILRPLEPFRDDLLVVSGLAHHGRGSGVNAHEHCAYLHLTGASSVGKVNGKPQAPMSVDQRVASHVGGTTFLPSLELATTANGEQLYSFTDDGNPVPYETNPRLAFDRMFRGRPPRVPNWKERAKRRAEQGNQPLQKSDSIDQSVLDLVREETRRLQNKVGKSDRQKLDQYLDSVGSVERRIALVEQQAAEMFADGMGFDAELPKGLPANAHDWDPINQVSNQDPEVHAQFIDVMSDLLILALQTDTTRVVTFSVGSDGALLPGVVTVGFERHFHTLEHQGGNPDPRRSDPISREACRQASQWFVGNFARTVEKMKAIDEGGTSLLSNTMTLFTSYMADGGHHREDYPVLLVGDAQGTLKTGQHVAMPSGTPMSNLYVEMLDRMGVRVSEFGESNDSPAASFDGRLPGLV